MKKFLIMFLMVALLGTFAFAGGGKQQSAAPSGGSGGGVIKIGVSMDNLDDPFWVGIKTGLDAATKELGNKVQVDFQICQGDANKQNQQIQNMITSGDQAIACVYVDNVAIKQAVKLCNAKNIPFVYIDRTLDSSADAKVAWGIATDNYALTVNGWNYMADYAKKNNIKWKVLELVGSLTDDNVLKRTNGFKDVMAKNTDIISLVQSVPTDYNLEKVLAGVTNALQANPDINCIFMHSDMMISATIQALQSANRYAPIGQQGHIALMPFSGNAASVDAMQNKYAEMCFGMDVYKEGHDGLMAAYDLATGNNTSKYSQPVNDPGFIVTQDNLSQMLSRMYGSFAK